MARVMMVFLLAFSVYGARMVKKRDYSVKVLKHEGVPLEDSTDAKFESGDGAVNSTETGVFEALLDKTEEGRRRCCGVDRRRGKGNCNHSLRAHHRRRTTCDSWTNEQEWQMRWAP